MVGHVVSDSFRAPDSSLEETAPLNMYRSRPSARTSQIPTPASSSNRSVFDPAPDSVFNVCDSIDRYRFPSDATNTTVQSSTVRYQHDSASSSTVSSNVLLPLQTEDDSFQSLDPNEYSELCSPLDTTNRFNIPPRPPLHDPSILLPHRPSARSSQDFKQRAPFRSVSLPQKLASAHGKFRIDQQESGSQNKAGSTQAGSTQSGSRILNALRNYGNNSTDAIPSTYRKQRVSSDQNAVKAIGRSRTEPHISVIPSCETEGLAINPASIEEENFEDYEDLCTQAGMLCMVAGGSRGGSAVQRALQTPDILRRIFEELDMQTVIPQEIVQERRKPASLMHAQLIYGKTPEAIAAWQTQIPATTERSSAGLFNCLLVNKLWHDVAVVVLEGCIHFRSNEHWTHFARRGVNTLTRKPKALVLHKLNATQVELEMLDDKMLGSQLEWLEFYTCSRISPTKGLLGERLKKIALPGCNRVNDQTLFDIAHRCPRLEYLDVRACDRVSDTGVKVIARYCPNLQLINVGRTEGGERITYKAIKHLARLTNITTLGLAGCDIDDRAIWELALNRGPRLERLSLNNCRYLTDAGLPRVLGYLPNLTVLEIRGCLHIKNVRPIALFKLYNDRRGKYSLIEGCEIMERCIQVSIARIRQEMNTRRLTDLTNWVNRPTDN